MQANCKQLGLTNFELVVRLSDAGKQRRWDFDFIKEIVIGTKDLEKIWVCGPPIVTETFEKTFYKLQQENLMKRS